jgi:predicted membrane-bound dolichyl-phosphate-mannose-protein mannosyltransferase
MKNYAVDEIKRLSWKVQGRTKSPTISQVLHWIDKMGRLGRRGIMAQTAEKTPIY